MAEAKTFDLFEFIEGRSYPSEDVTVYTDAAGVFDLEKIEEKIANTTDPDEVDRLDAETLAIKERIRESALTFHLRGVPGPILKDVDSKVEAKFDNPESNEASAFRMGSTLALQITGVTRADGATDTRVWDSETSERVIASLPPGEGVKLLRSVIELSLKSRSFEDFEVTPDFS